MVPRLDGMKDADCMRPVVASLASHTPSFLDLAVQASVRFIVCRLQERVVVHIPGQVLSQVVSNCSRRSTPSTTPRLRSVSTCSPRSLTVAVSNPCSSRIRPRTPLPGHWEYASGPGAGLLGGFREYWRPGGPTLQPRLRRPARSSRLHLRAQVGRRLFGGRHRRSAVPSRSSGAVRAGGCRYQASRTCGHSDG